MDNKKYCIYCHTNKINGKKYIGQTSQNPKQRWKNGSGYKKSILFYNAILKYGWENFEHEILIDGLTLEEANTYEEKMIAQYNTTDKSIGYNIRSGGENQSWSEHSRIKISNTKTQQIDTNPDKYNRKPVFQYLLDGSYIKTYKCAKEASEALNISESSIRSCCHNRVNHKTAGGFIWKYEKDKENECVFIDNRGGKNKKAVIQYDKDGSVVNVWESATMAHDMTNINTSQIIACCRNKCKSAGGYIWMYLKE